MFGIKIHRPSPALAVAVLALLVALSGTAYAAATLPANSVGTAQLKMGAVTLTKIAASAQGALKPRAWAEVKSDGTILKSSGFGPRVSHPSGGLYGLTLTRSATHCAAIATVNTAHNGYTPGGSAETRLEPPKSLIVHTQYFDTGSFYVYDIAFSVVVYC